MNGFFFWESEGNLEGNKEGADRSIFFFSHNVQSSQMLKHDCLVKDKWFIY